MKSLLRIYSILPLFLFPNVLADSNETLWSNSTGVNFTTIYDGETSALVLTRNKPIRLQFYYVNGTDVNSTLSAVSGELDLSVDPVDVTGWRDEGDNGTIVDTLVIQFDDQQNLLESNSTVLQSAKITFEITTKENSSWAYWELTSVTVQSTGELLDNCTDDDCSFEVENKLVVAPRNGYTSRVVDKVCSSGYSTCAPRDLCWTCYLQTMRPQVGEEHEDGDILVGIQIPGMLIQPFYGNRTDKNDTLIPLKRMIGYNWDCDPILSANAWVGVIITLAFGVLFLYAISYLADVNAPGQVDREAGKPIHVPVAE